MVDLEPVTWSETYSKGMVDLESPLGLPDSILFSEAAPSYAVWDDFWII